MPLSMLGIGVVTMMSQASGRYDIAGALSAVLALSGAVLAPHPGWWTATVNVACSLPLSP